MAAWVMIEGVGSTLVRASLRTEHATFSCIGSVIAKQGCWSFLKGGFVLDLPSDNSILYFQVLLCLDFTLMIFKKFRICVLNSVFI